MLALAICIYFLSDNIVSLVLDASYQDVAGYLSALSPLFITVPLMRLADQFMLATDYFNENLIINIGVTCGLLGSLAFTDAENGHYFALIIIAWQLVHAVTAFTFINSRLETLMIPWASFVTTGEEKDAA